MNNETTKLLWIFISITIFLIAITGTALLVLTGNKTPQKGSTIQIVDNNEPNRTTITEPIEPTEIQTDESTTKVEEESTLASNTENSDPLIEETEEEKQEPEQSKEETINNDSCQIVEEKQRTKATITQKATNSSILNQSQPKTTAQPKAITQPTMTTQPKTVTRPKPQLRKTTKQIWVSSYWIQTGSFSLLSGAEKNQKELKTIGFQSTITTKVVDGKTFYRLRIGSFSSKKEAEQYLTKLKSHKAWEKSYITKTTTKKTVQI